MDTNNRIIRIIAVMDLVFILPAALFLISVIARNIEPLAYPAQQIVIWYATRFWTLWVLMITLPLAALLIGCSALFRNLKGQTGERQTARQRFVAIRNSLPLLIISVSTLAAVTILAVVGVHMLMY